MTDQRSKQDELLRQIQERSSDEDAFGPLEDLLDSGVEPDAARPVLESLLTSANADLRGDAMMGLTAGGARVGYEVDILLTIILCLLEDSDTVYTCEILLLKMRRHGSEIAKKAMDVLERSPDWKLLMGR
jgi:hypothetical protein